MSSEEKEHFINGIKVSKEVAQKILSKSTYFANNSENLKLYNDFVAQQKEQFKAIMYYFNDIITELKDKGKISSYMEFRARIKGSTSALKNDEKNNIKLRTKDETLDSKSLDDVFGMEFIGANEDEIDFILSIINKETVVARKKDHNKPNGYKAKHRVFAINDETAKEIAKKFNVNPAYFPLFEAQFKTIEVVTKSSAAHTNYKKIDPEVIQRKYDNDEFILDSIPQMWVSKDGQMQQLSSDETLKKIYPFLDITKKKNQDRNQ